MRRMRILRIAVEIARYCGCPARDLRGMTLGDALSSVDRAPVVILWGLYSKADLEHVL